MNKDLDALERKLEIRNRELVEAHRHIAALEEKLLKLKQYRRELKLLTEQKEALRKSPERRLGQILLVPYRLSEKLAKRLFHREQTSRRPRIPTDYQKWFEKHRATTEDLERMRNEARTFGLRPLISVVTPVFDTPVKRLDAAVESVLAQAYDNWELILIDDGSTDADLLHKLPQIASRDQRIVLTRMGTRGGISAASNHGLSLARGQWVAFLDHDDLLEPDALFHIVALLQTNPEADLIYSDEDKLGDHGFEAPMFKPDWSPDLFESCNYVGHLTALRRDVLEKAGRFRSQFDSAQDYDLFFRVIEQTNRIYHIPRVLYHWRRSETSSAISVRQKPGQLDATRLAIEGHLNRRGERADVVIDWHTHTFSVRRQLWQAKKISVIVQNCNGRESLERCLETLTSKTNYPNYEISIIGGDDFSGESSRLSSFPHRWLRIEDSACDSKAKNCAVEKTDAAWLLFLDDRVEVIEPDWLMIMAEHVQRTEIGAVGAQLVNSSGSVEHAGIVLGVDKIAQLALWELPAEHASGNQRLQVSRNCAAVSSACMLTRREVFEETGGFDDRQSGVLADADLCLKMRRASYMIVYTPFAKLCWHATHSDEKIDNGGYAVMRERWGEALQRDPYYNPNLSRERADFSLGK